MFVKVPVNVFIEVKDEAEAEAAAQLIDSQGDQVLGNGFPHGEIAKIDVPGGFEALSDEQVTEEGLTE